MAVTLNEGNLNKLVITIPSKGDTDWAPIVQTAMQDISDHDHTGNGKGAKIGTAALEDNSITSSKIADSSVTTAKLADDAVTGTKIADNSITADHIVDGTIIAADVANDAITTDKILDSNVTTAKIADSNVTTAKIADANVTTAKIADANVTAAKIGSDVVLSTLNDVSSTAPTSGQVLKWSGSEWSPGTDASAAAGTVVIANQTDASAYSPSAGDVVVVNAAVTFSQSLSNIIIISTSNYNLTFNNNVYNCNIRSEGGDLIFDNISSDGVTDMDIHHNTIRGASGGTVSFDCSGNTAGNEISLIDNTIEAGTGTFSATCRLQGPTTNRDKITVTGDLENLTGSIISIGLGSVVHAKRCIGKFNITTGSSLKVTESLTFSGSSGNEIQCDGTTYINSAYDYPFTANERGVNTNVVVRARKTSDQSVPTSATLITYDTEDIDNTSCFSSSRFTAKIKGYYKVRTGWYQTRNSGGNAYLYLRKNGSNYAQQIYAHVSTSGSGARYRFSDTIELEVGDYIEIFSYSDTSGSIQYDVDTVVFTIEKING